MKHGELESIAQDIEPIVRQAGALVLNFFGTSLEQQIKHDQSIVTRADLESESLLKEKLAVLIPKAGFFAEESAREQPREYTWVIDPLDGTTNFARGLPYFCISLALAVHDRPVLGVVFDPLHERYYTAIKGAGAFCNGRRLKISHRPQEQALILVSLPYRKTPALEQLLALTSAMAQRVHGIRSMGAVALDLAAVASGIAEGCLLTDLGWWDVAAGSLLVEEAGGRVSTFSGELLSPDYTSCLAASQSMYEVIRNVIERIDS